MPIPRIGNTAIRSNFTILRTTPSPHTPLYSFHKFITPYSAFYSSTTTRNNSTSPPTRLRPPYSHPHPSHSKMSQPSLSNGNNTQSYSNGHTDPNNHRFPMLQEYFEANQRWASRVEKRQPGFFEESAKGQKPEILWIGCESALDTEAVSTI